MESEPHLAADAPVPAATADPLLVGLRAALGRSAPVRFTFAMTLPLRAAGFLRRHRRLWPYVVVPALINVMLFVVAAVLLIGNAGTIVDWVWTRPAGAGVGGTLLTGLWYVVVILFVGLGLILAYAVVLLAGGIVASPFNDALSEKAEMVLARGGRQAPPEVPFWRGVLKSIGSTARVLLVYLLLMLPVLLLDVIPVVGTLAATVVGGLVGAFFVALEYADVVFERHGLAWKQKVRLLRSHLVFSTGFGLGTSFILWLPLINFLCIPIAVIGGTAVGLVLMEETGAMADRGKV